jgi:hypothetical protein
MGGAYALQFDEDAGPAREAVDAILAWLTYPIATKLDEVPLEVLPLLARHVVRAMLTAFLQVTKEQLGRGHRRMPDTLEREALKFADRPSRAIEEARQASAQDTVRLEAEVESLRLELAARRAQG